MSAQTSPPPPMTMRERWIALFVLCTGMLMIILDGTIVNVALPSIQEDLAFEQSDLAWVVNAYLIPFGGLLLLAGRLGDLAGRRRIFSTGLIVFIVASLACGLAASQEMLIGARFLQGVGGAMTSGIFLFLAGLGHIRDMRREKNFAPGNTVIMLSDFGVPISLVVLLISTGAL